MTLLALLLVLDALLHFLVIARFGISDRANLPFLIFGVIDALLAIAVFLAWPYAVWAALVLSAVGLAGLTATFGKPARDKGVDRVIWGVEAAIVVVAASLLFAGKPPQPAERLMSATSWIGTGLPESRAR